VKVLVTGATGFTGGQLAKLLAARGDDVKRRGAGSLLVFKADDVGLEH